MNIKEYLNLGDKAIEYDFSNDGADNGYKELDNSKEKFFAYMMVAKKSKFYGEKELYDFFKEATKLLKDKVKKYGNVFDPDSKSELLQEIYKVLWDIEPLNMKYTVTIDGETLNSVNTTLNKLYEFIEGKLDKGKVKIETERYKRESMKTKKGNPQPISIKYIISKYLIDGNSEILLKMFENKEVETFLSSYHTLGNFMPIPKYCNVPRGNGLLKDYWDLTLLHIFKYYKNKDEEEVVKIIGVEQKEVYKEWLDSFDNWNNFVEKNYLEAFVDSKEKGYYPKELWLDHFKQTDVYPINDNNQGIEQCLEYFRNASECIKVRGKQMIDELKGKVKVMLLNNSNILEIKNSYVKIYDMNNPLKVENVTNEDIVFLVYDSTRKLPDEYKINEFKTLTIGIIINDDNQETIDKFTSLVDSYIVVSKNNIANLIDTLANMIFKDGLISLDLDDIKSILEESGRVRVEIASSKEPNRLDVVNQIIENLGDDINKIDKMIIHCLSDNNLSLFEMEDIIKTIKDKISENACVIYGNSIINEDLYTKVTVIASFKE